MQLLVCYIIFHAEIHFSITGLIYLAEQSLEISRKCQIDFITSEVHRCRCLVNMFQNIGPTWHFIVLVCDLCGFTDYPNNVILFIPTNVLHFWPEEVLANFVQTLDL